MQEKNKIFANTGLSNIFKGALIPQVESDQSNRFKVIGYRLERAKAEHVHITARSVEDSRAIYHASTRLKGFRRRARSKHSFFFPKHWTEDDVINAVFEAYQKENFVCIENELYVGKTIDGMKIALWLDEEEKVVDAMPLSDEIQIKRRVRKVKSHCGRCGQPKHYVCLEHHNFKKTGFSKVTKHVRYYSKKIYFTVGEKLGLVQ